MPDFEQMREQINDRDGFMRYNGIRVTALDEGCCECEAVLSEDSLNPHGFAHGGLLFSMCDSAAGIAATTTGRKVVTQSADIHFLRPAMPGTITARGKVIKVGIHTAYCTAEIYDRSGLLLVAAGFDMFFLTGENKG